jgi:hypothetical protein
MGYLKLWKQNLAALIGLLLVVGLAVGLVIAFRGKVDRPGPGDRATAVGVVVEGTAPRGAAVTFADDVGASVLARDARLPFRTSVPTDDSSFYQLEAQALGSGSISCRIALGVVVEVRHASGKHRSCIAAVAANTRGPGWHPS